MRHGKTTNKLSRALTQTGFFSIFAAAFALFCTGCLVSPQQNATAQEGQEEPEQSGPVRELLHKRMEAREGKSEAKKKPAHSNFSRLWYDEKAEWTRLTKISISPVDASRAINDDTWKELPEEKKTELKAETEKLSTFMKEAFVEEIKARSQHSWQIVEKNNDETAVLMLSLIKITPSGKPGEAPEITMEGRLTDHKTSVTVMIFSDTKKYEVPSGAKGLGNANDIVRNWADSFAEMTMPSTAHNKDNHDKLKKAARMAGMHFMIRKFMD
ncbi:MAG: hypothetical protein A2X49_11900 [Lentisphaerae bacterium GWF2_52_8]|nr:MAG: hypothetical protein A2X49_11900 [Lentisphaerae bacterium GWF2_52_8]